MGASEKMRKHVEELLNEYNDSEWEDLLVAMRKRAEQAMLVCEACDAPIEAWDKPIYFEDTVYHDFCCE